MAPRQPLIRVFGSLNMDLVSYCPRHPAPGETLTATSFVVSPGGKGANQAVACAKLSRTRPTRAGDDPSPTARVAMAGRVGADAYGAQLRANLASQGVDVSSVADAEEGVPTGVAVIIVDEPTGQNRIVLSPGANHAVQTADLARAGQPADLLVMQLEIPLAVVLDTLRTAAEPVLLNPAPAAPLPAEAYEGLAHLVLNETEAAILAGCDESLLEDEDGLESVAKAFVQKGVLNVIITLGGRGVFYATRDGKRGLVPAEKAKVVDTTAAGDTFVGQYALEVVSEGEFDIAAAVRKANRAAAKTVERQGAQNSIPWRDELD